MTHEKIKSLNIVELESILSKAINAKLGVDYKINISNIEYTDNGTKVFDSKKEITNLKLSIINKTSINVDYSSDSDSF